MKLFMKCCRQTRAQWVKAQGQLCCCQLMRPRQEWYLYWVIRDRQSVRMGWYWVRFWDSQQNTRFQGLYLQMQLRQNSRIYGLIVEVVAVTVGSGSIDGVRWRRRRITLRVTKQRVCSSAMLARCALMVAMPAGPFVSVMQDRHCSGLHRISTSSYMAMISLYFSACLLFSFFLLPPLLLVPNRYPSTHSLPPSLPGSPSPCCPTSSRTSPLASIRYPTRTHASTLGSSTASYSSLIAPACGSSKYFSINASMSTYTNWGSLPCPPSSALTHTCNTPLTVSVEQCMASISPTPTPNLASPHSSPSLVPVPTAPIVPTFSSTWVIRVGIQLSRPRASIWVVNRESMWKQSVLQCWSIHCRVQVQLSHMLSQDSIVGRSKLGMGLRFGGQWPEISVSRQFFRRLMCYRTVLSTDTDRTFCCLYYCRYFSYLPSRFRYTYLIILFAGDIQSPLMAQIYPRASNNPSLVHISTISSKYSDSSLREITSLLITCGQCEQYSTMRTKTLRLGSRFSRDYMTKGRRVSRNRGQYWQKQPYFRLGYRVPNMYSSQLMMQKYSTVISNSLRASGYTSAIESSSVLRPSTSFILSFQNILPISHSSPNVCAPTRKGSTNTLNLPLYSSKHSFNASYQFLSSVSSPCTQSVHLLSLPRQIAFLAIRNIYLCLGL